MCFISAKFEDWKVKSSRGMMCWQERHLVVMLCPPFIVDMIALIHNFLPVDNSSGGLTTIAFKEQLSIF